MSFKENLKKNLTEIHKMDDDSHFIESLAGFVEQQQLYKAAIKEIRTKLEILDEEFKIKYDHNPIHHMEYRLKSPDSIVAKLRRRDKTISLESIWENLTDVAGVRLICHYLDDIYRISEMLLKHDDIKLIKTTDYILYPKPNGYRSLHLIVEVPVFLSNEKKNVAVEIQIRTIGMDFWACLEHRMKYKSNKEISDELRLRLRNCAETISELDEEMQEIYREITSDDKENMTRNVKENA